MHTEEKTAFMSFLSAVSPFKKPEQKYLHECLFRLFFFPVIGSIGSQDRSFDRFYICFHKNPVVPQKE